MRTVWRNICGRKAHFLAALALAAAACGGGAGDASTTPVPAPAEPVQVSSDTRTAAESAEAEAPAAPAEPVRVRAAITDDEATLTPYSYISGFPGWNLLMLQYDSLLQLDSAGRPRPWLAERVTVNDQLTEYSVKLVEGVVWHDGRPLTAADVAFTAEYFISNTQSRFARDLRGLVEVTVADDHNLTFVLEAPDPGFDLAALADVPIIPRHVWEAVANPEEHRFEGPNIGTGPYRLVEYDEGQSYRFVANPGYFRGAPAVDELVVVVFADDAGALSAVRSGGVDVIFERISPEQIALLDAQDPLDIAQGPEFSTQMINYDASAPPFDDPAVRKAVDLAMDRRDIVDTVYLGAATAGSPGWVHPDHASYNPAVTAEYDPARANALLDEAGYADGDGDGVREYDGRPMSFEVIVNSSDSLRLRIAELAAEMLAEIGISAVVASVETATWENAVWPGFDVNNGRNYQLAVWGWSAPVQANPLRAPSLVHSLSGIGSLNLTGFSDAEVDEVSEQLLVEPDPQRRLELLGRLQELIADRLPFVLLAYPDGAYVYDSSVYADWEFIAGQGIVGKLSLLPPSARP